MSNQSMRVLVFANNEEKDLRTRGQELASATFPGFHIVNRSPRYFNEESSVEPCAAIFVQKKQYPELVVAYKAKDIKIFDIPPPTKAKDKTTKTKPSDEPTTGGEQN